MTAQRSRHGATVDSVLFLLESGRPEMAGRLLESLAVEVHAEMRRREAEAFEAGYAAGQRDLAAEITQGKPKRPRAPKRHEWLAERLRNPQLRERAKAVLRLNDDALLDALAEGRVGLGSSSWRKLREALGR